MIKVLVVDDSAIVRDVLSAAIEKQPDMELVGTAPDPFVARDKIVKLKPDVITLDIEMPRMDGLSFLERIMHYFPLPVIIVSSVTTHDPYAAVKALELGAFDVVNKPGGSITVEDVKEDVLRKIRAAYEVRDRFIERASRIAEEGTGTGRRQSALLQRDTGKTLLTQVRTTEKLIAIGASTGGTVALEQIFRVLPAHLYPIVVVQHMPPDFTRQFAQRLHELSNLDVKEGEQEEILQAGTVYIAPGGYHMEVQRRGASLFINLNQKERIHFQRPAVDMLFHSVAREVGQNALGILLTGMGRDGAEGLLAMKKAGAMTIAQDEESSIVWGMPRSAVELGAAAKVLPLEKVPAEIITFCS
ncbi:chemotaxis response regulator protein-glutamate methylesterase [Gracilinema caldarium]|uniref:protein-glutamate methylesterase/protein-glutamine glutaminase n=1 Tax=Gracilinema caldarium TaxID=215591 RepID=UPI0026EBC9CD|nr:chemotaxis response regulator protein-glutamate methylesterase [Gracilinema caldarium]